MLSIVLLLKSFNQTFTLINFLTVMQYTFYDHYILLQLHLLSINLKSHKGGDAECKSKLSLKHSKHVLFLGSDAS